MNITAVNIFVCQFSLGNTRRHRIPGPCGNTWRASLFGELSGCSSNARWHLCLSLHVNNKHSQGTEESAVKETCRNALVTCLPGVWSVTTSSRSLCQGSGHTVQLSRELRFLELPIWEGFIPKGTIWPQAVSSGCLWMQVCAHWNGPNTSELEDSIWAAFPLSKYFSHPFGMSPPTPSQPPAACDDAGGFTYCRVRVHPRELGHTWEER